MKTVWRFLTKFASLIGSILHSFDRVIFKGHLPIEWVEELTRFVDYELKMRRSDFMKKKAPACSEELVEYAKRLAKKSARTFLYRTGDFRKEEWARGLLREQRIIDGLVGILCTQETCPSFCLVPGEGRPQFKAKRRQQRVLYYYFLDAQLGFMHVRMETWFPFAVQVYVNGHDWLAQQMTPKKIGFVQRENAFVQLDDVAKAQKLANRFAHLNWPRILNRFARLVNPLWRKMLKRYSYYWVTDQAEFSTDLLFRGPSLLTGLYQKLLEFAVMTFSAKDVLKFLGRKYDGRLQGEVQTDYKTDRWPGARIKHRMRRNWLKMYDKFGLILRIETVINDPKEFKVYRACHHHDGTKSMGWYPMPKGVGYLPHYQEQALACNRRYLEALAVVDDPAPAYRELAELTERKYVAERSSAGFNPASRADASLFAAVLDGDGVSQGFANKDVRARLFGLAKDGKQALREGAAVNRLLKRLHARGLLAKVPRRRRWRVTTKGRHLLGKALALYRSTWPELFAGQAA
jgi:hypothetical protein